MTAALFNSFDSANSIGDIVNHPMFDSLPMDALETVASTDSARNITASAGGSAAANPKPAPVRSASESRRFVDSMRDILNSNQKPPAPASAVEPDVPNSSTSESLLKNEELGELTQSRSWANLGPHQEVNMTDVFRTQQEAAVEEPKVEKKPAPRKETATQIVPNDQDVLLGRGGRSGNHPGNKRYLALKDEMQVEYFVAEKNDKKAISQKLVDIVNKEWNGRFLKLENKRWVEISNEKARQKASQALRELNTPEVRAKKRARYGK